uniref:leucine-rich repeat protein n=1 Tax=Treponema endosymbiont of Eucomonympha sp. TaxID=1580831 RepID=UPI000AD58FBF
AGASAGCARRARVNLPAAAAIEEGAFRNCAALASANLPAAAAIGTNAFRNCYALASLTLGATPPELGATVFYDAGKDTAEGFTIYVPNETAQTTLEAKIATAGSDWYTALNTGIEDGKYDKVAVTP